MIIKTKRLCVRQDFYQLIVPKLCCNKVLILLPTFSVEGPSSTEIVSLEMDSASSLPTARNDYSKTSSPITLESYGDGIMKSPNYPNSYSNDADCRWQMHRKSNQSLFLIIVLLCKLKKIKDFFLVLQF